MFQYLVGSIEVLEVKEIDTESDVPFVVSCVVGVF